MSYELAASKKKNMSIEEVNKEILKICKDDKSDYKENKKRLINLFHELEDMDFENEVELNELISLHRELTKIQNRKATYLENEIARRKLVDLPFQIRMNDEEIPEDVVEILEEEYQENQRLGLKLSSQLLKYGKEIIGSKEDKSKRCKNRIKEAIRMLNELQQFYEVKGIKQIFQSKIHGKDKDLQFFSLYGLEIYYAQESADKITKEEVAEIEKLIKTTKMRETASTCCQILLNSGNIDEFGAMIRIDDWKDRNWK